MTTIAYRGGVLASDSRVSDGDTVLPGHERKIFRLPDGCLFAASGSSEGSEMLLRAMRRGSPLPKLRGDRAVDALMVTPAGHLFQFEGTIWARCRAPYYAIGSGSDFALGALFQGATAVEAVRAGMKFDAFSGGKVQVLKVQEWSER
jgi:20S proteasome alpha/beta subunit